MAAEFVQAHLYRIEHGGAREQIDAASQLARSEYPEAIIAAVNLLDLPERYPRRVIDEIADGLIEGAPATITEVIAKLDNSPLLPSGNVCAYILGEIAYRQGKLRDKRILPALIRAVGATINVGTAEASYSVSAIRECARAGPVPEATPFMEEVLAKASGELDPYLWTIDNSLWVLYINEGEELLHRLPGYTRRLRPRHGLLQAILEFMSEAEHGHRP